MKFVLLITIDKFKTGMEILKFCLPIWKLKKRKVYLQVLILNLLSNPSSPIGQWAKETLSRDEAVAKPLRIKRKKTH